MKRLLSFAGLVCLSALILFLMAELAIHAVSARTRPRLPGGRAVVVDERYSPLRDRPDLQARLVQRLRRGRVVGLLGTVRNRRGERFHRVAVSRRRSGWIHELALIRRGNPADGLRLLTLVEQASDDLAKIGLARIAQREFRYKAVAQPATRQLNLAGERVAHRLTIEIRRRLGETPSANRRVLFLNYAGLDRYNRLGIVFDYDPTDDRLIFTTEAIPLR